MNFSLKINSIAGIRKASVFPEPVWADPTRSRPSKSGGMDFAWISVIVAKPISLIPINVASQTLSSKDVNFVSDNIPKPMLEPGTVENCYNLLKYVSILNKY